MTIDPERLEVSIGDMVEFRCGLIGSTTARIEWSRDVGDLPINAVMRNGLLRFQASSEDQQGRYACRATSEAGDTLAAATAVLIIHLGLHSVFMNTGWRKKRGHRPSYLIANIPKPP